MTKESAAFSTSPSQGGERSDLLPRLMGILNVTPDSFSDGGNFTRVDAALEQAKLMISHGATVIDVGGESTRPGAGRVPPAAEQARVLPIIEAIAQLSEVARGKVAISIDTLNSATATLAVAAGASIVNDVSGGQADPKMFETVAELSRDGKPVEYVLGHWANFEQGAGSVQSTDDIVSAVCNELAHRVQIAESAGLSPQRLILDPGLGFGKDSTQNWQLLAGVESLAQIGLPILIGASRKRFIASAMALPNNQDLQDVTTERRDTATAALSATLWSAVRGTKSEAQLWGFRVHNVQANFDALRVAAALRFAHLADDLQS